MKRLRVYVDTSVIGGCFDPEFEAPSRRLFERFRSGKMVAVISTATLRELEDAPTQVRRLVEALPGDSIELVRETDEVAALARAYLHAKVVPKKCEEDALHIACATVHRVDVLVSWNFKHLVNFVRIRRYNAINVRRRYAPIEIRSPLEVDDED